MALNLQWLTGRGARNRQRSLLGPEQQNLYNQLLQSGQLQGAGGAFGQSADYYRNLLSNDSEDFDAYVAPEMRRFNEDIIPGLAEQFAGMGSGGLSSSGFRNAAVRAGTDLSERLGAIRANLRQQGAQGLQNIGNIGLGRFNENTRSTGKEGLLGGLAQSFSPGLSAGGLSAFMGGR